MALLLALVEERDIILLGEWAVDQGPHFRREFYQVLLPLTQEMGKTIFATNYGDHYFIHADCLSEMCSGQLSELTGEERDAVSCDAVTQTTQCYDVDLVDCCHQINIPKIPSFLTTL